MIWDTVVVGAGVVGSAAGKYVARAGSRVAVIGPAEPGDVSVAEVFASHYDQGRVQRLIGFDDLWTRMSVESARAWPELERLTGMTFHDPIGCLYLAPHLDDYLNEAPSLADRFDLSYRPVAARDVHEVAPLLRVPDSVVGLFEPGPAGSINPRALVAAQLRATRQAGGTLLRDVVTSIRREGGITTIRTGAGDAHHAGSVIVATGSFTNTAGLLPQPLDVRVKGETVVLAEVSADTAVQLADLPSVLYEVQSAEFDGIYLIKPLRYPDGRFYLKLGMNQAVDPLLHDTAAIRDWFRGTKPDDGASMRLQQVVTALFPDVGFLSFHTKPCIISRTVDRRPYLGPAGEGLTVAMGCNGYSAMASDAQGRIAASLVTTGDVLDGYDAAQLAVRTRPSDSTEIERTADRQPAKDRVRGRSHPT